MIRESIGAVVSGRSLTMEETSSVMREIMEGEPTRTWFLASQANGNQRRYPKQPVAAPLEFGKSADMPKIS